MTKLSAYMWFKPQRKYIDKIVIRNRATKYRSKPVVWSGTFEEFEKCIINNNDVEYEDVVGVFLEKHNKTAEMHVSVNV